MRFAGSSFALWLCLLVPAGGAQAEALRGHDDGPLKGLFGFPDPTVGSGIASTGEYRYAIHASSASHNIEESSGLESLFLDGETSRLTLSAAWGLTSAFEVGVEIPYTWHHSGNLDGIIDDWHDFFGFAEGPRPSREEDRLDLRYSEAGEDRVRLDSNAHGVGDIRLLAGWQVHESPQHRVAFRFGIKLPTGDSARLLGSGGADLSAGIAGDVEGVGGADKLSAMYRADIVYLGKPDLLADRAKNLVGQVTGGIGYRAWERVDLRVQARIRSAVYDSAIGNLGRISMTLTAGAIISLGDRASLVLGFGEDIKPSSAPDISFQLALRYR